MQQAIDASGRPRARSVTSLLPLLVAATLVALLLGVAFVVAAAGTGAGLLTARQQSPPAAAGASGAVYVDDGANIVVLDGHTGLRLHAIPTGRATQSIFVAAAPAAGRLFVADAGPEGGRTLNRVKVYRTGDWTLERQIEVPDIIRYIGNGSGIAPSTSGQLLHVYNYNDRTRGQRPVQYWLSTFDLATGKWLALNIDLPGCGGSQLVPAGSADRLLFVLCRDTKDVRVVDVVARRVVRSADLTPVRARSGSGLTGVAAAANAGDKLYVVTDNREVHVVGAVDAGLPRILDQAASPEKVVTFHSVGVDRDGSQVFVPTGTPDERSHGLASEITVIDASSGAVARTHRLSRPFSWVAFAPDLSAAYAVLIPPQGGPGDRLVRLDLLTGMEVELLAGKNLFPGVVAS